MDKVKAALTWTLKRLGAAGAALKVEQDRWKKHHRIAVKSYDRMVELQKDADAARKQGKTKRAAYLDGQAAKKQARSRKASIAAQQDVARVKVITQQIHGLETKEHEIRDHIKALGGDVKVDVDHNKVIGGNDHKRLQVAAATSAARCAAGKRRNFYSQAGTWDVDHCLTGEPLGHRSDCSSWFTSVYKTCGLPDPNGSDFHGGFTGTLVAHGHEISREEARNTPGAAVIYGTGVGHHVEFARGDGSERTWGHGSAPVDAGIFNLLPGTIRFFKYALN